MLIFLYILLGVLLLLLVSGGYTFFTACRRRKELPWFQEAELKKTAYGKYYPFIMEASQWLQDKHAVDLYIQNSEGLRLHAYWVPAANPKGTILLAHGYRSNLLVDFSRALQMYHAKGLNILVPHQRCHGESEGTYITFGVKESNDFLEWIEYHNKHCGNYPMIISGLSMGASTVLFLADRQLPENVKGIIADCGFTSPNEIISKVFNDVVHLPGWICMWSADIFARIFAGFSLKEKDTRKALSNCRLPVFMIHGTADDFVPCSMTQEGYDACASDKDLLLVEGAGHGVSFVVDHKTYIAHIDAFLSKTLGGHFELRSH